MEGQDGRTSDFCAWTTGSERAPANGGPHKARTYIIILPALDEPKSSSGLLLVLRCWLGAGGTPQCFCFPEPSHQLHAISQARQQLCLCLCRRPRRREVGSLFAPLCLAMPCLAPTAAVMTALHSRSKRPFRCALLSPGACACRNPIYPGPAIGRVSRPSSA